VAAERLDSERGELDQAARAGGLELPPVASVPSACSSSWRLTASVAAARSALPHWSPRSLGPSLRPKHLALDDPTGAGIYSTGKSFRNRAAGVSGTHIALPRRGTFTEESYGA